jgi:hypothetical protein
MQHRRFAGARRPDQSDDFARLKEEIDAIQHRELDTALMEHTPHIPQFESGYDIIKRLVQIYSQPRPYRLPAPRNR